MEMRDAKHDLRSVEFRSTLELNNDFYFNFTETSRGQVMEQLAAVEEIHY